MDEVTMAGSSLSATLDIILKDDVTKSAAAIEASLNKMMAEAKAADEALARGGASDKFAAGLKRLGASVPAIEGATKAMRAYAEAEQLAANRGEWTRSQAAGFRNMESVALAGVRAQISADKALQAQQHARMEAYRRDAERVAEQRAHGEAHHGFASFALQTAAMAVSAHAIVHGIEATLEHGAEYQHRLVALQNSGRTPEEIARMNEASHAAIRGVPTATLTGNLEILNETVGAFGSVEHALEHLPFMNKAASILHAVAGDKISDSAGAMGNKFARFFEMRGTAGNSELFEKEASEMMKSMVFSGGNVNPSELLNFAQQAKSALQNYDLHFLSRIAPSLIGEVGGDRAGTQANAFNSVLLGKVNDKKQAEAWQHYNLVDPKQMTMKAGHAVGWTGGAVYHTDEALKDPLAFGEKYVLPALAAKGIDINNQLELTKALGTLFRNQNANAFSNELWQRQNRNRLHKDEGYIGDIETPAALYKRLLRTDPTFAMIALKGSLGNFLTTLSSPMMGTAATSLSGMAERMNELALVAHDNPMTALTAGITAAAGSLYAAGRLSYGLLNGFGNATFGATAGEMATAGHEQLAAGRMMLGAAEAMRVGAVGHDLPGVLPGGKLGAVAREGETLAAGALTVESLEIAATAGVTLTAGTVALVGLTAGAFLAALMATTKPKDKASDKPGFGDPYAPNGFDPNDPKWQEEQQKQAAKHWWDRDSGRARHGAEPEHHDLGPHYQQLKNAPFFMNAPLGPNGLPFGFYPGMSTRSSIDPTTGTRIGTGMPLPRPELYAPADVPLPPQRPDFGIPGIERRTLGAWINSSRGPAAAGEMPAATPPPKIVPEVDSSGIDALKAKTGEAHAALDGLNTTAAPQVSLASLDAFIAKIAQARAEMASLGSVGGGNAAVGARRSFQAPVAGTRITA